MAITSVVSTFKTYCFPSTLLVASLFFQLIVIPSSFPPSHYEVLGIPRYSSIQEVTDAYEKLSSEWKSSEELPTISNFIEIQYAFELLTNPLWKRNYDVYGIEEQHVGTNKVKMQYAEKSFLDIPTPLLDATSADFGDHGLNVITSEKFQHMFEYNKPLLIQVYSLTSKSCAEFLDSWKRIVALLDGVTVSGMVELGNFELATYLAEKGPTGQPIFPNGIPSFVAIPLGCRASDCLVRYDGGHSVDAVTDWFATKVLNLPRILYHTKESLGQNFLAKASSAKVKVIFFSSTGERATPLVRQVVKDYWAYASFAFVLWQEEDSLVWWNAFEVESAPAIVILRDPGVKPFVYHGLVNGSWLLNIMEKNKQQELPQLRSVTSLELGCDPRGYSRAGNDTTTWYCVILAGRQSLELDNMRKTIRRVQETLTHLDDIKTGDGDRLPEPSAIAVKQKRLTFTWLDGEMQKDFCSFYLNMPYSNDACGPRRYPVDVPQLFIVRYVRNSTDNMEAERNKKPKVGLFQQELDQVSELAAQLVARYNGSEETSEIVDWISKIVKDGDNRNLPFYKIKAPALVPEDSEPIWSGGTERVITKGKELKQRIQRIISGSYLAFGPMMLLGAVVSFSSIWLRQKGAASKSNPSKQPTTEDGDKRRRRSRARNSSGQDQPTSITDVEPKNAYQCPLSDSDSE